MKKQLEDNTVSVIQKAVMYYKIPVTKSTVKEALKSHSSYPSFKSICDTLNEWKIENYPLKYKPEELREITAPYIVHFENGGGQIAFVTDLKDNTVTYYDSYNSKRKTVIDEFYKKCSGAVILMNPDEKSGEKDYRKKWQNEAISSAVLPLAIIAVTIFLMKLLLESFGSLVDRFIGLDGILLLTKTIGIVLSLFLVLHEFEIRTTFTDKLCHLNKAVNCNTVLNDKVSKIFGWFGWADAGFIYFTGGLIFLVLGLRESGLSYLAILSALSLPYPLFSIYYQGFVLKKWCPFCLGVQIVLIFEFILLLPVFSELFFSFVRLLEFFAVFLFTGIAYSMFILYTREKASRENYFFKYMRFKKNPEILKILILRQKHYEIPVTNTSLVFGKEDPSLMITAFLSLHCSHCARAFEKIKDILDSEANVEFNLVLVTSERKIINTLYQYKSLNIGNEALELIGRWYGMDPFSRSKVSEALCIPDAGEVSEEVGNENNKLFKNCGVIGTPTFFINGYKLPAQYDIDDIIYFPEVFSEREKVKI